MTTSTWQDQELPILRLVVEADGRGQHLEVADIAEQLSLDEDTAVRVVDSLHEAGYLTGVTVAQRPYLLRLSPTPEARRAAGQWPMPGAEMYDRLLEVLDERIAAEPDERKRTRLQRFRDGAADVGRSALGGVLVELGKFGAGMAG